MPASWERGDGGTAPSIGLTFTYVYNSLFLHELFAFLEHRVKALCLAGLAQTQTWRCRHCPRLRLRRAWWGVALGCSRGAPARVVVALSIDLLPALGRLARQSLGRLARQSLLMLRGRAPDDVWMLERSWTPEIYSCCVDARLMTLPLIWARVGSRAGPSMRVRARSMTAAAMAPTSWAAVVTPPMNMRFQTYSSKVAA